jgi:hypothetical protein
MKRIAMIVMPLAAILFTAGCGKNHDDRDVKHDVKGLAHEAASDATRVYQDARQAARDLGHAAAGAAEGTESEVRQAAAQLHDDVHSRDGAIRAHGDADYNRPADPAELREEAKRDAVNAAGAAAEQAAEKLLKFNR